MTTVLFAPRHGRASNADQGLTATEIRDQVREQVREGALRAREAALQSRDGAQEAANGVRIVDGDRSVKIQTGPDGRVTITKSGDPLAPPPFPGTVQRGRYGSSSRMPPEAVDIAQGLFTMIAVVAIGWPLARAFGRRIERRSEVTAMSPATTEQLQRIEQGMDAMAIEIERISESQRFMAKLQSANADRSALPADRH